MKVSRVFNNNVVMVETAEHQEMIVLGKGLGFQKKKGDEVQAGQIEKTFVLKQDPTTEHLLSLLTDISPDYLELSMQIVQKAENGLAATFRKTLYLTLMDHISFSVSRHHQNEDLTNPLLWDTRQLYQKEYAIGKWALQLIEEKMGVLLPEDEAASIALHLVNAQGDSGVDMSETMQMTKEVKDIINIVRYMFNTTLNEHSLNYDRFLIHLRFFLQRMHRHPDSSRSGEVDQFMFDHIRTKYPQAFRCALKIGKYIGSIYPHALADEEKVYLTLHIQRVTSRQESE